MIYVCQKRSAIFFGANFSRLKSSDIKKAFNSMLSFSTYSIILFYVDDYPLSTSIRKLSDPGLACCTLCKKDIKYASSGKNALIGHRGSAWHAHLVREQKSNYTIACKYVRDFM